MGYMDSFTVLGSCVGGNEPLGYVKDGAFVEEL